MEKLNISSDLFMNSFSEEIWKNTDEIDFLVQNLISIEDRIKIFLAKTEEEFPFLTDHSIIHSKALWNYADIIIGNQPKILNPLEAFILHCSFLVHDAGMCYSILYDDEEMEDDPIYKDYITQYGSGELEKEDALFLTTRLSHGENALKIATEKLSDGEFLISDIQLREEFGQMIGIISKSHTCNINFIEEQFVSKYSSPKFPRWSIDRQKLCFILRTSDAAHLDNLRTPKTNRMIQMIEGSSKEHWTFQNKLGFPQLSIKDSLLIYTTNMPFDKSEQNAWWLCHDSLKTLDKELKQANEYFEIHSNVRFRAKGVKSINDPLQLGKKYIKTKGWTALDTNVKVRNPANIAVKLGGITLYGQPSIALRELIQNSIDAINIFRFHTTQESEAVGEINISLSRIEEQYYLKIKDNGIGMSQTVLTNHLLDFGGSYWKSNEFNYSYRGIISKGFDSIGKFGIGFFSSFMLGEAITVTSWKYGTDITEMKTLDFFDSLESTPILREPTNEERKEIIGHGTSINIKLKISPYEEKEGFIKKLNKEIEDLYSLVKYYVPSSNVKINIDEAGNSLKTIVPNIFTSLSFEEFINYIKIDKNPYLNLEQLKSLWKGLEIELIELGEGLTTYGRIALLPSIGGYVLSTMIVISGGIRVTTVSNLAGYLETNNVISIRRSEFISQLPFIILKKWAVKTRDIIEKKNHIKYYGDAYSSLLISFGLHNDETPFLYTKKENQYFPVKIGEIKKYLKTNSEIKIYQETPTSFGVKEKDCDGFIIKNYGEPYTKILKDEDKSKIISPKNFITEIITSIWGAYQITKLKAEDFNQYKDPYWQIEIYTKK